jgi:glutamate-1-semialdehyde aminotransferase
MGMVSVVAEQHQGKDAIPNYMSDVMNEYVRLTPTSKDAIQRNRRFWCDNRNSANFRLPFKESCYPVCFSKAKGPYFWDLDGNRYVDIAMGFGVNFMGHSHPVVVEAIEKQMRLGFALGPQCALAGEVAKLICELTGTRN